MKHRKLGNTGIEVSILGFGCMRLPTISPDKEAIKHDDAIKIIRKAIDAGVNYVDTAEPYHNGESEVVLGKALKDGYREKVTLVTKSPVFKKDYDKPEKFEEYLEIQLKRLDVEYIDIYLLHSLNAKSWKDKVLAFKLIDRAKKAQKEGKIKRIGFSFHDKPEVLKEIIDSNAFEVMLVQYNILDTANEEMLKYAKEKGIGTVIMGPVAGGRLAGEPHEDLIEFLPEGKKNFVDLALKFIWTNPNVDVLISGMGSEEMVDENLAIAKADDYTLTEDQMTKTKELAVKFKGLTDIICTSCKYCEPCPEEVNISVIFSTLIRYEVFGQKEFAKLTYKNLGNTEDFWPAGKRADACIECGECELKCPQKIQIIEQLKKAHEILSS